MNKILGTTRFHVPVSWGDVASRKKISLQENSLVLPRCGKTKYITAATGVKGCEKLGHYLARRGEQKAIVEFDFLRAEPDTPAVIEVKKIVNFHFLISNGYTSSR